jgi:hypothetical protein
MGDRGEGFGDWGGGEGVGGFKRWEERERGGGKGGGGTGGQQGEETFNPSGGSKQLRH